MPEPRTASVRSPGGANRTARGRGRALSGVVAAAALPAVVLGGLGSAAPASAAELPALRSSLTPLPASGAQVAAAPHRVGAHRVASHRVASHIPARVAVPAARPAAAVVRDGDTLSHIAARHGVALASVLRANGLSAEAVIQPGQRIRLTAAAGVPTASSAPRAATHTVASGDTLSGIAHRHGMGLTVLLRANGLTMSSTIHPGTKLRLTGAGASSSSTTAGSVRAAASTHTVAAGDTLSGIAQRHGIGLPSLLKANGLSGASTIHPGQRLTIGGSAVAPTASGATRRQLVPSTFLHYRYPTATVRSANDNKHELLSRTLPSRSQMKGIIAGTARKMGVDPSLALAHAYQESGFDMAAVSPANAIGAMQVIPTSGEWASQLVGRKLDLLDPYDNATAGIAIIRSLQRTSTSVETGIASYYQGQGSVKRYGMYADTKRYVRSIQALRKDF
ncbi:lytic transglycosylase [Arthrobacter halodurans]|uniref:LysM peptidoglycan-binding domain-containing protein n=1 Tax=Arthrobacter halodurans TaxID=516699 RepID=A0ABV4UIN4_9MICC